MTEEEKKSPSILNRLFGLENAQTKKAQKEMRDGAAQTAAAMKRSDIEIYSIRCSHEDGTVTNCGFSTELAPLRRNELILTTVKQPDFFEAYVNEEVAKSLGHDYEATHRAFNELLSSVKRRAPFDDLFADKKGHYLSLSKDSEKDGSNPLEVERDYRRHFCSKLEAEIARAKGEDSLTEAVSGLVEEYSQLLPYTIRTVYFADNKYSMNFGKMIEEKFGADARKNIGEHVLDHTEGSITERLKLVTIDEVGRINAKTLLRGVHDVAVNPVDFLAASGHYSRVFEAKKAEKKQRALEQRMMNEARRDDIEDGIKAYVSSLIETPGYMPSVLRTETGLKLEEHDYAAHVVANVVASHPRFEGVLRSFLKDCKKGGKDTAVWCEKLDFPFV